MAVFTPLRRDELVSFLEPYRLGGLIEYIPTIEGSEHTTYILMCGKGKYVLTLFENRMLPKDIPQIITALNTLKKSGFCGPEMLSDAQGDAIKTLKGKPVVLQVFLPGTPVFLKDLTPQHCLAAGQTLARLHRCDVCPVCDVSSPLSLPNRQGYAQSLTLLEATKVSEKASYQLAYAKEKLLQAAERLERFEGLPSGFCHGDYFPDNVFFEKEGQREQVSAVIDFWFSCQEAYVYDLAIALNAFCFKGGKLDKPCFGAFLKGYTQVRALEKAEEKALVNELARAALRFAVTRFADMASGMNKPDKDPFIWITHLEFHQKQKSLGDYV